MKKGVIIRHLILPGMVENSLKVIDYVSRRFKPGEVLFSLMRQYTPFGNISEFPELQRTLTDDEYEEVVVVRRKKKTGEIEEFVEIDKNLPSKTPTKTTSSATKSTTTKPGTKSTTTKKTTSAKK